MRKDLVAVLACPHCSRGLVQEETALRCAAGHSFDIARQGYVSLLGGAGTAAAGDSADMVAARARFLDRGHYAPLMDAVAIRAAAALGHQQGCLLDVGAGTGHYLAAALQRTPDAVGLAVDAAKAAARRAAHVHPRAGSVLADTWQALPVRDDTIDIAMTVFAPRSPVELRRVLHGDGTLLVLTPTVRHLQELVGPLGLLRVDERKPERLDRAMGVHFVRQARTELESALHLDHDDLEALVGMGPSAWHASAAVRSARIALLPGPMTVTASVVLSEYRPSGRSGR